MRKVSYRCAAFGLGVLRLPGGVLEQTSVETGVDERHARFRRQNICWIAADWKRKGISIGSPGPVVHGQPVPELLEMGSAA